MSKGIGNRQTALDTSFDEKHVRGSLYLVETKKVPVLHLPHAVNGTPRRRLKGCRNQCPTCNEYFNSSNAFEQHRTGSFNSMWRCLTVAEMQTRTFSKTEDDYWLCPVSLKDRERLNRLRVN